MCLKNIKLLLFVYFWGVIKNRWKVNRLRMGKYYVNFLKEMWKSGFIWMVNEFWGNLVWIIKFMVCKFWGKNMEILLKLRGD